MEKGRFKTLSALEESRMAADENKVEIALLDSEFKHEVAREPGGENIKADDFCHSFISKKMWNELTREVSRTTCDCDTHVLRGRWNEY